MSKHPIDFLREEFLNPMGVTQEVLCERLGLGSKTVSELYSHKRGLNVTTAKKFGKLLGVSPAQLLQMQAFYDLDNDSTDPEVQPLYLQHNTKEVMALLSESASMMVDLKALYGLFKDGYKNNPELVVALFKNVPLNKTVKYMFDSNMGLSHLKKVYEHYLAKLGGNKHPHVERLLLDDDAMAMEKLLNNENFFHDPRDFEQYLFYRVAFMRKKTELLKLAQEKNKTHKERQRAAFLYEFVTGSKVELDFVPEPVRFYENSKRPMGDVNHYGVFSSLDKARYQQFVNTGNF